MKLGKLVGWGVGLVAALMLLPVNAGTLILNSGKVITGEILRSDEDGTLIKLEYGTFTYPKSVIKDVKADEASGAEGESTNGIPHWGKIVSALAKRPWANELKQVPATVIDNGPLKNVPYLSFRCATDGYEINIYGDLDAPAGVEIGTVGYLVKNPAAKSNCIEFISSILTRPEDRGWVGQLGLKKEVVRKNGLTFETTLPDEPDAYGGWWVSVYDEAALEQARASGSEVLAISDPVPPKPKVQATPVRTVPAVMPTPAWSPSDYSYSSSSRSSSYSSGGSGRVYVRGYHRKDGTYVRGHTRSRPRR